MKKLLILSIISTLILSFSSCSKKTDLVIEDLTKYNISYNQFGDFYNPNDPNGTETDPEFIIVGSITSDCNTLMFDYVNEMWEASDYVVVASPQIPYSESEQKWLDKNNKAADFEKLSLTHSYSTRPFKVTKVYKGENLKLKEIQVCEHVLTKDNEMRVKPGSYPTEQGTKYILFLFRANTEEEQYFPLLYQGKYSLNDSENKEQKNISQDMYKQVKEKFKDEIK